MIEMARYRSPRGLTCDQVTQARRLASALTTSLAEEVVAHLATCDRCRAEDHTDVPADLPASFPLARSGRLPSLEDARRLAQSPIGQERLALLALVAREPAAAEPLAAWVELVQSLRDDPDVEVRCYRVHALAALAEAQEGDHVQPAPTQRPDGPAIPPTGLAAALLDAGQLERPATAATLLTVLKHGDEALRATAAAVLGDLDNLTEDAIGALVGAAGDASAELRAAAVSALSRHALASRPAFDALLAAIHDGSAAVRGIAAGALGRLAGCVHAGRSTAVALAEVVAALGDRGGAVRVAAARSLGTVATGNRIVQTVLVELLRDREADVRVAAVEALRARRVSDAAGLQALAELARDASWRVRRLAIVGVSEWPASATERRPALERFLKDERSDVRALAGAALAALTPAAGPAEPLAWIAAVRSQGKLTAGRFRRLVALARDADARIRGAAEAAFAALMYSPMPALAPASLAGFEAAGEGSTELLRWDEGLITFDTESRAILLDLLATPEQPAPGVWCVRFPDATGPEQDGIDWAQGPAFTVDLPEQRPEWVSVTLGRLRTEDVALARAARLCATVQVKPGPADVSEVDP